MKWFDFLIGASVAVSLVLIVMLVSDVSRGIAYADVKRQCERNSKVYLTLNGGGEAMFYCYREPKK